jgi:hypothetical protein
MIQTDLFDLPVPHNRTETSIGAAEEIKSKKREAMARVDRNADSEFKRIALKTLQTYAMNKPQVTANDVWDSLDALGIETHDNRALGPLFTKAAKAGWIEKTNMTLQSNRKTRHGGDVRVWRSLVYGHHTPT